MVNKEVSILTNVRNIIGIIAIVLSVGMMFNTLYSHTQDEDAHLCKGDVVFKEAEKIDLLVAIQKLTIEVGQLKNEVSGLKEELRDLKRK